MYESFHREPLFPSHRRADAAAEALVTFLWKFADAKTDSSSDCNSLCDVRATLNFYPITGSETHNVIVKFKHQIIYCLSWASFFFFLENAGFSRPKFLCLQRN